MIGCGPGAASSNNYWNLHPVRLSRSLPPFWLSKVQQRQKKARVTHAGTGNYQAPTHVLQRSAFIRQQKQAAVLALTLRF